MKSIGLTDLNWRNWLKEGAQYLKAGSGKDGQPSRFSPTIQYNLLSMSLEAYVMAIVDMHGSLPDNHTFTDLLDALERVTTVPAELKDKILHYETAQNLCSFADFHIEELSLEALADFRGIVREIEEMAHQERRTMTTEEVTL